jgi:hypothetical protein
MEPSPVDEELDPDSFGLHPYFLIDLPSKLMVVR